MKSASSYINEALKLGKSRYNYQPQTKKELLKLIEQLIDERGYDGDFNDIDTSKITDMSELFYDLVNFNGDISPLNFPKYVNNPDISVILDVSISLKLPSFPRSSIS